MLFIFFGIFDVLKCSHQMYVRVSPAGGAFLPLFSPTVQSRSCEIMTGQTEGGLIRGLSGPSMPGAAGLDSRPLGGSTYLSDEAITLHTSTSQLARSLLGRTVGVSQTESSVNAEAKAGSSCDEDSSSARRKREFIPDEKKDEGYWDKRRKNNEAAKKSREKRRANDMVLERRVLGLLEENAQLRAELLALKFRFGLVKDPSELSILPLSIALCPKTAASSTHLYHTNSSQQSTQHVQSPPPQQDPTYGTRGPLSGHGVFEESGVSTSCSSSLASPVFFNNTLSDRSGPSPRALVEEPQACSLGPTEGQYLNRQDSPDGLRSLPHKLRFKTPSSDSGEIFPSCDKRASGPPVATVGPSIHTTTQQQRMWDSRAEGLATWGRQEACCGSRPCPPQPSDYYTSSQSSLREYPTEDMGLRSQISCLSQEVAQLKRLFSQQLLTKIS